MFISIDHSLATIIKMPFTFGKIFLQKMNKSLKIVLLTLATLSLFTIALVELSGVSSTAIFNTYKLDIGKHRSETLHQIEVQDSLVKVVENWPKTEIAFIEDHFDFGEITTGDIVSHSYEFENTGKKPLIIAKALTSCGCTVPNYPKQPIAPGAKGKILVEFDSKNKVGLQEKNILIYANTLNSPMSIGFTANVKEKL